MITNKLHIINNNLGAMDSKNKDYPFDIYKKEKEFKDLIHRFTRQYCKMDRCGDWECDLDNFKLSDKYELLAAYLEYMDFNSDEANDSYKANFGSLLRNITPNNILEFGKTIMENTFINCKNDIQEYIFESLDEFISSYDEECALLAADDWQDDNNQDNTFINYK